MSGGGSDTWGDNIIIIYVGEVMRYGGESGGDNDVWGDERGR